MPEHLIQIPAWWTEEQELDEEYVTLLFQNELGLPAPPAVISRSYELIENGGSYRDYALKWGDIETTCRVEVVP